MQPFDDEAVTAITGYMNDNMPEANLAIVQVHGRVPTSTSATLIDVGGDSARFIAQTPDGEQIVDVPWTRSITRRDQIRDQLVELYMSAG